MGHNPYFSRWFSAIEQILKYRLDKCVTILILVDGFLQFIKEYQLVDTKS